MAGLHYGTGRTAGVENNYCEVEGHFGDGGIVHYVGGGEQREWRVL